MQIFLMPINTSPVIRFRLTYHTAFYNAEEVAENKVSVF